MSLIASLFPKRKFKFIHRIIPPNYSKNHAKARHVILIIGLCNVISTYTLWLFSACTSSRKSELFYGFMKSVNQIRLCCAFDKQPDKHQRTWKCDMSSGADGQHQIREIPRGLSSCNVTECRSLFPLWHVDLEHRSVALLQCDSCLDLSFSHCISFFITSLKSF